MDDIPRTRWRGELVPSLVAAVSIVIWLLLLAMISMLLSAWGSGSSGPPLRLQQLGELGLLTGAFALAAWISFWLVSPITKRSSFSGVLGSTLFAGLVASIVMWPVQFVLLTGFYNQVAVDQTGGLYDLENLDPIYTSAEIALLALTSGLQLVVARLPLLALAALVLWWWLRRKEVTHVAG
jgi:hypothetical protein